MARKAAVIGAGPMGMAAAYQLALDGVTPVLFEADDRVGGMTASFDFDGLTLDRFYHFHCVDDKPFFALLEELGLASRFIWCNTKMGYWFGGRLQPWGDPVALLRFRGLSLVAKFRYGLHAFINTKRNDWRPLDKLEASAWLKRWVGREAWEVLWRPLFEFKLGRYADKFSAAWIWSRIHRIGRSRYNLFREKLGYVEGGCFTVTEKLRAEIERLGGDIRLSSPVRKVTIENNRVAAIETADGVERFDAVVSTVPLPFIPEMMPDLPEDILEKYRGLENLSVACVVMKLRRAVSEYFWLNISDPDVDLPGLVEYTNLNPLKPHILFAPYYLPMGHEHLNETDASFFDKTRAVIRRINPEITDDDFIGWRVQRYTYAQPVETPRFPESLPPTRLPVAGLWVADTSHYYPWDRGASESIELGRTLAREVAGFLAETVAPATGNSEPAP
ncbi:MAG: NAD(P)/FAD-dependent oxidoreductase [Methylobacteriaceae bacterium]|jgi:protoporphyrinogen oxidase|nr:NAD(P)/FAD-dependent oxidoreductase [Methylobacteriaceae bacterium]